MRKSLNGFTVVELLIVIAIIGILVTIGTLSFSRTQAMARDAQRSSKSTVIAEALEKYYDKNGEYPSCNAVTSSSSNVTVAVLAGINPDTLITPSSPSTTTNSILCQDLTNIATDPDIFAYIGDGSTGCVGNQSCPEFTIKYKDEVSGQIKSIQSRRHASITCPAGFIAVPGSSTYGTSSFCTMKYDAKNVSGVATSQAAATPWVNISQTAAISAATASCTGCHLITDAEYLTIAQNALSVASNWSGSAVGSGFIYSGHNDNIPANTLAADIDDSNGYSGTGNSSPANQRRTLTLSNGEVIWDIAGNVLEWTAGTSTTGQPGMSGEGSYAYKEWPTITTMGALTPNSSPAGTNLVGAGSWNSSNGVGQLYSYSGESALRGVVRGGHWTAANTAGVLSFSLNYPPSSINDHIGFRASK